MRMFREHDAAELSKWRQLWRDDREGFERRPLARIAERAAARH